WVQNTRYVEVDAGTCRKNQNEGEQIEKKDVAVETRAPVECFKSVIGQDQHQPGEETRARVPAVEEQHDREEGRVDGTEKDDNVYPAKAEVHGGKIPNF